MMFAFIRPLQAVMSNGILEVNMTVPEGFVTGVSYLGIQNLLNTDNTFNNRGFWSITWINPEKDIQMDK